MAKLTREDLEQLLQDDIEMGDQGYMSESVRSSFGAGKDEVGQERTLRMMESVRDQGKNFSWRGFTDFLKRNRGSLQKESGQSATAFAPYYRLGVQVLVASGYKHPDLAYDSLCATRPSTTLAQPYASSYRPTMPSKGFGGLKPKQISFQPRSKVVTNEDFVSFYDLERKAIEDDQTSTFNKVVMQEGENYSVQRQIYYDAFISGATKTAFGMTVPAPSYTDNDGLSGIYNSTRGNKFNSDLTLSESSVEQALYKIEQMTQPGAEGQLILVQPDVLYTSVQDKFSAKRILMSESAPAIDSSSSTNTTGYQSINPVKGELKPVRSPWLTNGSWYVLESKADSIILQERHPLETAMEEPNAGDSFEKRAYRYRWYMRWAMFWYECRYIFQGHA